MENKKERVQAIIDKGLKSGASAVKVKGAWGTTQGCNFKNGTLKDIDFVDKTYYHVTVIKDGKLGTGTVSRIEDIEEGLERASDMVKVGKQVYYSTYPKAVSYPDVKLSSPDVKEITTDRLINESETFCREMNTTNADFNINSSAFMNEWHHIAAFSNGCVREFEKTAWWIQGGVQISNEGDIYGIWDFRGSCKAGNDVTSGPIIDAIRNNYESGRNIASAVSGNLPVIFDPACVNALGWILTTGVNGKQVLEKASPLADKLGDKILSDNITVIDDPHIDYDFQASDMDDDGIPTRRMTIIDKGVLKTFAYDLNTASQAGVAPTGHSGCNLNAGRILPGTKTWKELMETIGTGLYVQNMLGFGQGNIINGDFNANVGNGYLIRDGNIIGRVKDTMISGNLYELAKQNVLVSSNIHPQYRQPWLVLDGVSVSSKG